MNITEPNNNFGQSIVQNIFKKIRCKLEYNIYVHFLQPTSSILLRKSTSSPLLLNIIDLLYKSYLLTDCLVDVDGDCGGAIDPGKDSEDGVLLNAQTE